MRTPRARHTPHGNLWNSTAGEVIHKSTSRNRVMKPMYLREVENHRGHGPWADAIREMREKSVPIPQIMHLFAYKPDRTTHLVHFTQGVMRGPSPLAPGMRELIAAFTSRRNDCQF